MADFNEQLPEWQAAGVEPPESKRTTGWQVNDKPPAGWLNWLFNRIYAVLIEIRSVVSTHKADYIRQPAYATTSGTSTAYIVTLSPAPTSLPDGLGVTIVPHVANGASPTLNINGLGAVALKDNKGNAYAAGKLQAGKPYMFRKVGADFLADSASGGEGTLTASDLRAGKTGTNDNGDVITGTVPVRTGGTVTPGQSTITKLAGIYDTDIVVAAVPFDAAKVVNDTTIAGKTGTMVRRTGGEYPGYERAQSAMSTPGRVHLYAPNGAYIDQTGDEGGGHFGVFADDPDFIAPYFRSDKNFFGLQGSMPVITSGSDPAQGVGKWGDGSLAVYPSEGYRKGGPGAGEIKVSVAQLQSVNAYLQAAYIPVGAEIFGINGAYTGRADSDGITINRGQIYTYNTTSAGQFRNIYAIIVCNTSAATYCGCVFPSNTSNGGIYRDTNSQLRVNYISNNRTGGQHSASLAIENLSTTTDYTGLRVMVIGEKL
ncbi:hypothetical protein [Paenibacillus zanthoxyli]|uniref:hypothetical protein n=1 Tax=Paenibacillus zanthoxyli TaxID=369399 RepID=UPI00046F6E7A|nr:hypothetical protein [Paenibacillus zanthoxyli]